MEQAVTHPQNLPTRLKQNQQILSNRHEPCHLALIQKRGTRLAARIAKWAPPRPVVVHNVARSSDHSRSNGSGPCFNGLHPSGLATLATTSSVTAVTIASFEDVKRTHTLHAATVEGAEEAEVTYQPPTGVRSISKFLRAGSTVHDQ